MAARIQQNLECVGPGLHRQFARGATAAAGEQPHLPNTALGLAVIHVRAAFLVGLEREESRTWRSDRLSPRSIPSLLRQRNAHSEPPCPESSV